jgi:hypothetical protein
METKADPFFANIPTRTLSTSAGPCELPILYTDASLLTLVYAVDPAAARGQVDTRAFEPWVIGGRAWAMLCAFEYRETTIGPYAELGVGVLVKRLGTSPSVFGLLRDMRRVREAGLYVTNLPVTTDRARSAGVELWGYPKYTTRIPTFFGRDEVRVGLEGEVEVTMKRGFHLTTRGLPLVTCSVTRDGRILRTVVETDSRVQWGGGGSVAMKILGDGPTAKTLRALAIDQRKPSLAFCTNGFRAILPVGEEIASLGESPARAPREVNGAAAHL